ncbi:GLPGLI family protein [Flavobacterium agricola]|uniref:GLPGLI family protein n=1 Tax=Flavobacterium agricola TaxID=2870839 RepID=A0ABY6M531_9FLAO|nr:GLPGLI family protein [Flavobacterium agricola]
MNLSNGLRYTAPYHNYVTNYDFTSKTIEENRALKDGTVLYARWDNDLVWEISDEEKTIGNYTVRKATTNSIELNKKHPNYPGKVTAWFCPEIPIPAGPARYYGLPGLILELKYQKDGSTYKLKSIEGADDYKFKNITTENQVEKEDVIYFEHKNSTKVKETQKLKKRS